MCNRDAATKKALLKYSRVRESQSAEMMLLLLLYHFQSAAFKMHHKRADSPDFSILTATSDPEEKAERPPPLDRFEAIRVKLDCFSHIRSVNKEAEAQQKITRRLAELENRLAEQSSAAEVKIQLWKEQLCQMRVQAQQQQKRCSALLKKRGQAIKDIRLAIEQACLLQQKEEEKSQLKISQHFDHNFRVLTQSLERECNSSIVQINTSEQSFEQELPRLHQRIITSNGYHQNLIKRIQKEVIEQSEYLQQLSRQHTEQQSTNNQSMLQLIEYTAVEIEDDIASERNKRRGMREKLEFLITAAMSQLPKSSSQYA